MYILDYFSIIYLTTSFDIHAWTLWWKLQRKNKYTIVNRKHNDSVNKSLCDGIELSLKNTNFSYDLTIDPDITYNLLEQITVSAKTSRALKS